MILPLRVFGSSGVKTMLAGFAIGPIFLPTWLRSSSSISSEPSSPPLSVTYATIAWPVRSSFRPRTVAGKVDVPVLRPVRLTVTRVVLVDPAQHGRPRTLQHEIAAAARPDLLTALAVDRSLDSWKRLRRRAGLQR